MTQDVDQVISRSNSSVSSAGSVLNTAHKKLIPLPTLVCFFAVMAVSNISLAHTTLQGVWRGQLGSSAITACFNETALGDRGSYYYNRHLVPIPLSATSESGAWREQAEDEPSTGTWSIDTSSDTAITGSWRSAKGGIPFPIVLQRVKPSEASKDCGSDAYVNRLETTNGITTTEKKSESGHPYTVVTKTGQRTLLLTANNDAATHKVNAAIAKIAYDPDGVDTFNEERRESLSSLGRHFSSLKEVRPILLTTHWVTVQFYFRKMGFGERSSSTVYHTWNLDTGNEINPWHWIGSQAKLDAWFKAHTQLGPECAGSEHSPLEMTFDANRVVLAEPATGGDCDLEYVLSWQDLKPMLSAEGKAAFDSLQIK